MSLAPLSPKRIHRRQHFVSRAAGAGGIPAFHRLNGEAIADEFAVDGNGSERGSAQGRGGGGLDFIVAGQFYAQRSDVLAEVFGALERWDAD